jgi:hypothetical protein
VRRKLRKKIKGKKIKDEKRREALRQNLKQNPEL